MEFDHENRLAKEIRDVYCQVLRNEYNLAVLMSQTNGLLAAEALQLKPCSRLEGFGKTLILSECKRINVNITGIETKCGFQPFFRHNSDNFTIGKDGWSIHPFSECFWSGQYININGKTYSWKYHHDTNGTGNFTNADWEEQDLTIHLKNLNLVDRYTEIVLNDYDLKLKHHPAHEKLELEQSNILAELVGRMQDTNSNSVAGLVFSQTQTNKLPTLVNWNKILNIISILTTSIIIIMIITCISLFVNPSNTVHK